MQQYEKSGPADAVKIPKPDPADKISALEQKILAQDQAIAELLKEIQRLKTKMDRHADHINRNNRG